MDILYIIGKGYSKCNYNELRYSLRSIEKYGKNVNRIFVAGYCPEWLSDEVIRVPINPIYKVSQNNVEKHINIINYLLYVVNNTDIGEDFLVSMDDHFYIKETDFNNYPIYAKIVKGKTTLDSKSSISRYGKFILNTKKFLENLGLPTYFFTLHRNMHVKKSIVNLCQSLFETIIKEKIACEPLAFLLNYLYSLNPFPFTPVKDIKIKSEDLWEKVNPEMSEVFSTSDFEENSKLDNLIRDLFPNKSKYEK